MKYCFYYYDDMLGWQPKPETRHLPLEDLFNFLDDKQMRWIRLKDDEKDPRKVIIWSEWILKQPFPFGTFATDEEEFAYGDSYSKYSIKRFEEMPKIHIFRDNYEFLEQQWEEIRIRKPKYLIIRQHDNGFIDIVEKNELSREDIANMDREHKIYLNYLKRWNDYVKAHPEKRSHLWRSPADNEFESDFALYDPIDEQGID